MTAAKPRTNLNSGVAIETAPENAGGQIVSYDHDGEAFSAIDFADGDGGPATGTVDRD
jgi:hypothetical protein